MKDWNLYTEDAALMASLEDGDSLVSNIALSLAVRKGSWWFNPEFGLDFDRRAKLTDGTADTLRQKAEQALQWILDLGHASSITVETARAERESRINLVVKAQSPEGREVTYSTFVGVI